MLREEIKRCEIKLNNERSERQKLSEKKSLEIAEIQNKVKLQIESMKSEKDFISRELDLSKEALRKKDRKIKDMVNGSVESPCKRRKLDNHTFHSPEPTIIKGENGVIPRSIDRALCDKTVKIESCKRSSIPTKDCGAQTVTRDKHEFKLNDFLGNETCDSMEKLNSLLKKYNMVSCCDDSKNKKLLVKKITSMTSAFTYLIPKIRDLVKSDSTIIQQNQLFHLLKIVINEKELNQNHMIQLFSEIGFVQRAFIKILEESTGKSKNVITQVISSSDLSIESSEDTKEPQRSSKFVFDYFLNFLVEVLSLLEETCELTSYFICNHNKGKIFSTFDRIVLCRLKIFWHFVFTCLQSIISRQSMLHIFSESFGTTVIYMVEDENERICYGLPSKN